MKNVGDIFDRLGGNAAVARGLGLNPSTVSEMRRRGSIPVSRWPGLIKFAAECNVIITSDDLVAAHMGHAA